MDCYKKQTGSEPLFFFACTFLRTCPDVTLRIKAQCFGLTRSKTDLLEAVVHLVSLCLAYMPQAICWRNTGGWTCWEYLYHNSTPGFFFMSELFTADKSPINQSQEKCLPITDQRNSLSFRQPTNYLPQKKEFPES